MEINQKTFIYSKSTIETLEKGVFIVEFEHISHLFLMFLFLTLKKKSFPRKPEKMIDQTNYTLCHKWEVTYKKKSILNVPKLQYKNPCKGDCLTQGETQNKNKL